MRSVIDTTARALVLTLAAGALSTAAAQANAAGAAADAPRAPTAAATLGTVTIPRAVLADGKRLPAAKYEIRLTGETAAPVVGQRPGTERWTEFFQGSELKGRALAIVIPAEAVREVTSPAATPRAGRSRVETLRAEDRYVRIWFNHGGDQVLLYLPYAP